MLVSPLPGLLARAIHCSQLLYHACSMSVCQCIKSVNTAQHQATGSADVQAAVRQEVRDAISPQHNCTDLDLTGVLYAY